ncbi:hypothetical protein CBL_07436 [Carabus blaptoides fortunei]
MRFRLEPEGNSERNWHAELSTSVYAIATSCSNVTMILGYIYIRIAAQCAVAYLHPPHRPLLPPSPHYPTPPLPQTSSPINPPSHIIAFAFPQMYNGVIAATVPTFVHHSIALLLVLLHTHKHHTSYVASSAIVVIGLYFLQTIEAKAAVTVFMLRAKCGHESLFVTRDHLNSCIGESSLQRSSPYPRVNLYYPPQCG